MAIPRPLRGRFACGVSATPVLSGSQHRTSRISTLARRVPTTALPLPGEGHRMTHGDLLEGVTGLAQPQGVGQMVLWGRPGGAHTAVMSGAVCEITWGLAHDGLVAACSDCTATHQVTGRDDLDAWASEHW